MEKNIIKKIKEMATLNGKMDEEDFYHRFTEEQEENGIDSPIEQLLYAALHFVLDREGLVHVSENVVAPLDYWGSGCHIISQYEIGPYKIDFKVSYQTYIFIKGNAECRVNNVLVECDGHEFHDKNESQRRYEKKRDRFLVNQGYKIFHFIGKEIIDDPLSVASEILSSVTGWDCSI